MQEAWIILLISFISGSTTVIGALLAIFLKGKRSYVSIGVGFSSGIMIAISFLELLASALTMADELFIIFAFAVGFLFVLIIDIRLPHMHLIEEKGSSGHLIKISYLIAIRIVIRARTVQVPAFVLFHDLILSLSDCVPLSSSFSFTDLTSVPMLSSLLNFSQSIFYRF